MGFDPEILEQKAKEGVEVRILYDGMNSFSKPAPRLSEGAGGKGNPLPDLQSDPPGDLYKPE